MNKTRKIIYIKIKQKLRRRVCLMMTGARKAQHLCKQYCTGSAHMATKQFFPSKVQQHMDDAMVPP